MRPDLAQQLVGVAGLRDDVKAGGFEQVDDAGAQQHRVLGDDASGVGYLLKDRVADFTAFAEAVRRVAARGVVIDPSVVSRMFGRRRREDPFAELTPREREVLELMAEGRTNRGIAEVLVVTPAAIEKHVTAIFSKLELPDAPADHRRVLAVLAFVRS